MAGLVSIRQVGPLITTLVGTHIAFSVASIARAGIGGLQNNNNDNNNDDDGRTITRAAAGKGEIEECFDAKHYDLMTDFVARMYRGRGIKSIGSNSRNFDDIITGVRLAPTVTFEDPAAICVSEEEVREAFRALEVLDPVSVSPPMCINVEPRGDSIDLTFQLNQQYTLPLSLLALFSIRPPQVRLRSLLTVTVQLQQMKDIGLPESEFLVTDMKELWYGNPLMWPYQLFYIPRRLNGIISYHLTSRFL